jgi:hypothetical protein
VSKAAAAPQAKPKGRSKLDEQLDTLLGKREKHEARIAKAQQRREAGLAELEKRYQKDLGKAPSKLARVDERLTRFVERHRYWLTRRHSKTIQRALGEIKVVLRSVELDLPKDEAPIIDFLLGRVGGKAYLIQTWKLDKRKLLGAPSKLIAELKSLGVWRGRHRTIAVKSPSNGTPKQLSRMRLNER